MQLNKDLFQNYEWLTFFRISISLFAILLMLSIWNDIPNMFLENAYIKPEILDAALDNFSPTIFDLHNYLIDYGLAIKYDQLVYLIVVLYLAALLSLAIGLAIRFSAFSALILQIVIIKSIHFFLYGVDFFLTMALFYCIIFPLRDFSIDNLLTKKISQIKESKKWSLILLQSHLSIIYFFSGLDKGLGINWYNGQSIWSAVSGHNYNGIISLVNLNLPNWIYAAAGILTLVTEFFYPIFINLQYTRKLWLILTVCMHLGIIIFMGLYFFGTLMILLNLSAYYFPYLKTKILVEEENIILLN